MLSVRCTSIAEQSVDMEHPSSERIWFRALEIFEAEAAASAWLDSPLPILEGHTPREYSESSDPDKQRKVLQILGALDYGMFS